MLRLTEKLVAKSTQHDHNQDEDRVDSASSICQFILKLLNTRQGSVLINPALGMPTFDISQGLQTEADKQLFLAHINQQIRLAEPRVVEINSQLKNDNNISVVMAFKLMIETVSKQSITMSGRLQSDSTFDLELI